MIRKLPHALTALAAASAIIAITTVAALAELENVRGFNNISNIGIYSGIDTAAPRVIDHPGGFSYMRVGGQRSINNNTLFIEIGCILYYGDTVPHLHYTWRPTNLQQYEVEGDALSPGNYDYEITYLGGESWRIFFNDMANAIATPYLGFDYLDTYFSGGEVSTTANGMGPSNNVNVQYMQGDYLYGTWYPASYGSGYQIQNDDKALYSLNQIINPGSWRIYGNNGP